MKLFAAAVISAGLYVGTQHHWFMVAAVLLTAVALVLELSRPDLDEPVGIPATRLADRKASR